MKPISSEAVQSQDMRKFVPDTELSVRQLAHELNSLLDGSLRHLRLARRSFSQDHEPETQQADVHLERVSEALEDMAEMIRGAIEIDSEEPTASGDGPTLASVLQQAVDLTQPLAHEHAVRVITNVPTSCREIPAGPLGPVIMNGLRNAIESCAEGDHPIRMVEASLSLTLRPAEVSIIICDSGPGLRETICPGESTKEHGRGIGLTVCRDIAARLGGRVDLSNIPFGGGAIFHARIPLPSLVEV